MGRIDTGLFRGNANVLLWTAVLGPAACAVGAALARVGSAAAFAGYAAVALYFVLPHATRAGR